MSGRRILFIADDLTGANDSGAQITKRGIETVTLLDAGLLAETQAAGIVIDTESRILPAEEARLRVRAAARAASPDGASLLYKKVDSTLRGHIGAELDELIRELAPDLVICAPAYPKNGRTTRGGLHFVDGVPLERTEFARDARNPTDAARLTEVLSSEGGPRFTHVGLEELRAGWPAGGARRGFFSFDCEEQEDLRRIVRACGGEGRRILWCGSAGLAEMLLEAAFPTAGGAGPSEPPGRGAEVVQSRPAATPVLSVIGSQSEVSRRQVARAVEGGDAAIVRLAPTSLLASPAAEAGRLLAALEKAASNHLLLTSLPVAAAPAGDRVPAAEFLRAATQCLAAAASRYIERNRIAGLFLTGGETAFQVVSAAGVAGMRIGGEIEPGVPLVRFIGGSLDGLPGVTKAGGFGGPDTIARAARLLAGRRG